MPPSRPIRNVRAVISAGRRDPAQGRADRWRRLRAPFFAPFGPDLDASRCLSRRDLVVLNAVTSGNTFVEVGESKLHGGFCVKAGQGVFHLFRACFWSFPSIPFESPGKPENCVKRVSPCQECVNKRAW